jgi:hypothetical protein
MSDRHRNSDLLESGIDEYADLPAPKKSKKKEEVVE